MHKRVRRNSPVVRSFDGGKTWEVFHAKPRQSNRVQVVKDRNGKLVVWIRAR